MVAYSAADMLVLGGRANSSFDVSQIGATAQYQGFGVFEKTGTSTWTLTGTTNSLTPWAIDGGTLAVSADDNLGAASGGLSFAGGTLQFLSSFTTRRAVTQNAGGGNFDTDGNNATLAGFISGSGGLTKVGAGVLTLSDTNSYSGGTSLDGGTLDLAALDAAGTNTITFAKGGEILKIENAALSADTFGNTINRFGLGDAIDLAGIGFGARTTLGYSENSSGTGGTLTVSDGADAAAITLLGPLHGIELRHRGRWTRRHAHHGSIANGMPAAVVDASARLKAFAGDKLSNVTNLPKSEAAPGRGRGLERRAG